MHHHMCNYNQYKQVSQIMIKSIDDLNDYKKDTAIPFYRHEYVHVHVYLRLWEKDQTIVIIILVLLQY